MLNNCRHAGELVLVVLDTQGNIFGGYLSDSLDYHNGYYGTGETFLFKVDAKQTSVVIFSATLENLMFLHCSSEGLGFGSDPHYGLFIEPDLTKGSTHACKTFANDVLGSHSHFVIKRIELWSFKSDLF